MYSGILTLILLFTILYMVVSRAILRLSSSKCQFKSFRKLGTVPGSRSFFFFYQRMSNQTLEALLSLHEKCRSLGRVAGRFSHTLLKQFFPLVQAVNCEISFIWIGVLRRQVDAQTVHFVCIKHLHEYFSPTFKLFL